MFNHVVFDLDGTLADTRDDLVAAVNYALRILQLPVLPAEVIYNYIGEGARRLVGRALGSEHQERMEEAVSIFLRYYEAHLLDRTVPYPGVPDTVARLRENGVVLSVLTNKPERFSRTILQQLGLLPAFSYVVGGDSLPARKPDPCGIDYLISVSGSAREQMLLVGDSQIDLQTARAAGVQFWGVSWGIRPGELDNATGVSRLINHAKELLDVLT